MDNTITTKAKEVAPRRYFFGNEYPMGALCASCGKTWGAHARDDCMNGRTRFVLKTDSKPDTMTAEELWRDLQKSAHAANEAMLSRDAAALARKVIQAPAEKPVKRSPAWFERSPDLCSSSHRPDYRHGSASLAAILATSKPKG